MGEKTEILWTDHTFSGWWGCQKITPECANCYAKTWAERMGYTKELKGSLWGPGSTRRSFGDAHWAEPLAWNRKAQKAGARRRVFCGSMMDIFEDYPGLEPWREKIYQLVDDTPWLIWMFLTKRIENAYKMLPDRWMIPYGPRHHNVWMGITAGTQKTFNESWPVLESASHVYGFSEIFISAEPLLEKVDFSEAFNEEDIGDEDARRNLRPVDWIIAGGESGKNARPVHPDWVRSIRDQCVENGAAFMFKQWGEWFPRGQKAEKPFVYPAVPRIWCWEDGRQSVRVGKAKAGRLLDGRAWEELPE